MHTVSKRGKREYDDKEDHSVLAAIVPSIVQKVLEQSGIRHQQLLIICSGSKNSSKLLLFQLVSVTQRSSPLSGEERERSVA